MTPNLTTKQDRGLLVQLQKNEDAELVSENVKRSRHEFQQTQKDQLISVKGDQPTYTIESQFSDPPVLSNFSNELIANVVKVSPVKIGGEIVGSNHFEEYNVRIDPDAQKGTILPGNKEQTKQLTQFLENEAIEVINKKFIFEGNGKKKGQSAAGSSTVSPRYNTKGKKKPFRYKTNFEISEVNQDPAHLLYEKDYLKNFDLDKFEFFDESNPKAMKRFITDFKNAQNDKVNKQKSFKLITELIYTQLIDKMNSDNFEGDKIPNMIRENQLRWCALITKTPRLQSFYNEFQEQLSKLLQYEISNNKDLYDMYMSQPRERLCHTVVPKQRSPRKQGGLSQDRNSTDRLIRRLSQDPVLNDTRNLAAFLHPKIRETPHQRQKMKSDIEKAKVNYQKMKEFKKEKAKRNVGVNKGLQTAVDEGRAGTIAEAALLRTKQKYGNLTEEERQHEVMREKIKAQKATDKILLARDRKLPMNQFQLDVKQRAEAIDELINSVDDNNIDLKNIVEMTETDLDKLEGERDPKTAHIIPGDQISKMMQMWGNEEVYEDDEIKKWSVDLWMSLQDYEKSLIAEEKGFKLIGAKKEKLLHGQFNRLTQASLFRFEAMETALVQTKLNMNRDKERLEMRIAEMESARMNAVEDEKTTDALVKQFGSGKFVHIQNVNEAKIIIKQFVKVVKGKDITIREYKKQARKQKALVDVLEERLFDKDSFMKEEQTMRKYYQKILLKAVRDLKVFDQNPVALKKFATVFEGEDEINYQRQIKIVLENIDLAKAMDDHANKYYGHIEGIEKIQQTMALIGMLDTGGRENAELVSSASASSLASSASGVSLSSQKSLVPLGSLLKSKNNEASSRASLARGSSRAGQARPKLVRAESNASSKFKKFNKIGKNPSHQNDPTNDSGSEFANPSHRVRKHSDRKMVGKQPSRSRRGRNTNTGLNKMAVARQAARAQMLVILQEAQEGKIDKPVIDASTGVAQVKYGAAREEMLNVLNEIDPDALENFKFLDLNQEKLKAKMKDTKADLKKSSIKASRGSKANVEKRGTIVAPKEKVCDKNVELPALKEKGKKDAPAVKRGTIKDGGKSARPSKGDPKQDASPSPNKKGAKQKKAAVTDVMAMTLNKSAEPVERLKDRSDHPSNIHDSMASLHSKKKELGFGTTVSRRDSNMSLAKSAYHSEAGDSNKSKKPRKSKKSKHKNRRKGTTKTLLSATLSPETSPDPRSSGNRSDSLSSSDSSSDSPVRSHYSRSTAKRSAMRRQSSSSKSLPDREPKMSQFARAAARQKQAESASSQNSETPNAATRNVKKGKSHHRQSQSFSIESSGKRLQALEKSSSRVSNANRNNGNKISGSDDGSAVENVIVLTSGNTSQAKLPSVDKAKDKKKKKKEKERTVTVPKDEPSSDSSSVEQRQRKLGFKKQQTRRVQRKLNQEHELQGVCLIQNELNELIANKYSEKLQAATKAYNEAKDKFRLVAVQVQDMREHAQLCMNGKMAQEDYSSLFKLEVDEFFKELNSVFVRHFDFTFINKYVKNGIKNPGSEDKVRQNITKEQKQAQKESLNKVNFGDMIKPNFSQTGQMLGFEIRPEMTSMLFMNNQYELKQLKRVIRVVVYMNRLIQEGHKDDFLITQIEDGQIKQAPQKTYKSFGQQVKDEDIKAAMASSDLGDDEEDGTPRTRNNRMLKNHLIGIIARERPQKVGYYKMVWEDMTTEKMMSQVMENVFLNDEDKADNVQMTYQQYLNTVLPRLVKGAQDIEDPVEKDMLTIDNLFKQVGEKIIPPVVKEQCVGTFIPKNSVRIQTDKMVMPVAKQQTTGMKKSKNQFVLDRAMEEEFLKTLQLFDGFAQTLCKIDESILQKKPVTDMDALEKINDDLQQEVIAPKDFIAKGAKKPGFQVQIQVVGDDDPPEKKTEGESPNSPSATNTGSERNLKSAGIAGVTVNANPFPQSIQNNSHIEQLDDLSQYRTKLQDQIQTMQKDLRFQIMFKKANKLFRDREGPKGDNEDLVNDTNALGRGVLTPKGYKGGTMKDKFDKHARGFPKKSLNLGSSLKRSPQNRLQTTGIVNKKVSPRANAQEINMLRRHNQTAGLMSSKRELLKRQIKNNQQQDPTTNDILSIKGVFSENQGERNLQTLSPHDPEHPALKTYQTHTNPESVRYSRDDRHITTGRSGKHSQHVGGGVFDVNSTDLDSFSVSNYNKMQGQDYDRRMHYPIGLTTGRDTKNVVKIANTTHHSLHPSRRESEDFEEDHMLQRYMEIEGVKATINEVENKDRTFSPTSRDSTRQKRSIQIQDESPGPKKTSIKTQLPQLNMAEISGFQRQTKQEVFREHDEGEVQLMTSFNTNREQSNDHVRESQVTTQMDQRRNLALGNREQITEISSKYSPSHLNSPSLRPVGSNRFKDYVEEMEFGGRDIHGKFGESQDLNDDSMLSPIFHTIKAVPTSVLDQALRPPPNKNQKHLSNEISMLRNRHRAMNQSVNYSNHDKLVNWQYQKPLDEFGQIQKLAAQTGRNKVHTNVSQGPWNKYTNHDNLQYLTRNNMIEIVEQQKMSSLAQKNSQRMANPNLVTLSLHLDQMKADMQMAKKAETTKNQNKPNKAFNNLTNKVQFQQIQQKKLQLHNISIGERMQSSRLTDLSIKNVQTNLNTQTIDSLNKQKLVIDSTQKTRKTNVAVNMSNTINNQQKPRPRKLESMETQQIKIHSGQQSPETIRQQDSGEFGNRSTINDPSIMIQQKKLLQRENNVFTVKNQHAGTEQPNDLSPMRAWSRMTKDIGPLEPLALRNQLTTSVRKRTAINMAQQASYDNRMSHSTDQSQQELQPLTPKQQKIRK